MHVRPSIVVYVVALVCIWVLGQETAGAPPLFVTNNHNNSSGGRLLEFDGMTGQFERLVGNINTPRGIAIGPDGNLYVASANGHSVLKFSISNGLQQTTFVAPGSGGLAFPAGLCFGPDGNLYVTSMTVFPSLTANVLRYDGSTGSFIDVFATDPQASSIPMDVSFGPDGNLYLATLSKGVFQFDGASGASLGIFVSPTNFTLAAAITFGPVGDLYVATGPEDAVLRYNGTTGTFIDTFVATGSGGLDDAQGIGFGPDGNLYVAGLFNDAILRYNGQSGDFIDVFASDMMDAPLSFVFVPEPSIVVDIKPGSLPNSVNLNSKGVLPVAILGTEEFDVNDVDISTLLFGDPLLIDNGGSALSPLRSALEDVSGDGLLDLTLKFSTRDLVEFGALGSDTIEGILTGALLDGTLFEGMDSIRIVPPNGSNGNNLQISAVPEPSTLALTALGLLGIGWRRRKRA